MNCRKILRGEISELSSFPFSDFISFCLHFILWIWQYGGIHLQCFHYMDMYIFQNCLNILLLVYNIVWFLSDILIVPLFCYNMKWWLLKLLIFLVTCSNFSRSKMSHLQIQIYLQNQFCICIMHATFWQYNTLFLYTPDFIMLNLTQQNSQICYIFYKNILKQL